MKVFHEINENKNLALALGYFDGVHIGHRKLLTTFVQEAKKQGLKTAVITFSQIPSNYFSDKEILSIQTFKDREMILATLGIDYLYELNFEEYKDMDANVYLKDVLVKNFSPKIITVGYNHKFGKDKSGNPALLREFEGQYGYNTIVIPEQKYKDKDTVSSTEIRKRIEKGHLNAIKAFLGREFSVRNSVIHGNKLARTFGIPTANLVWPASMVKLPYGVYFGFVQVDSKIKPALISWGVKPTVTNGQNEVLEAHIHDFDENLYGKIIKVMFSQKLRDEENFGSPLVLRTQLQKDYAAFQKWAFLKTKN